MKWIESGMNCYIIVEMKNTQMYHFDDIWREDVLSDHRRTTTDNYFNVISVLYQIFSKFFFADTSPLIFCKKISYIKHCLIIKFKILVRYSLQKTKLNL